MQLILNYSQLREKQKTSDSVQNHMCFRAKYTESISNEENYASSSKKTAKPLYILRNYQSFLVRYTELTNILQN